MRSGPSGVAARAMRLPGAEPHFFPDWPGSHGRAFARTLHLGMRVYRVIRAVNRGYPLAVLWLYVAAFLLAVVLMFMHPLGTIVLVWIGLLGLVLALLVAKLLAVVQRMVARNILAAGACPGCGGHLSGADA